MFSFSHQTDMTLLRRSLAVFFVCAFFLGPLYGQLKTRKEVFVDSLMATLDVDQKIGQLFMIRAFSRRDDVEDRRIFEMIRKYHVGGICFFQGSPKRQKELIFSLNKCMKI